jgi:hypothetical protein
MTNNKANEFYKDLKKLAQGGEALLNEFIHKQINQEELTLLIGKNASIIRKILERLHKYQDLALTTLKVPTKDDITNIAKLVLQLEEKLDIIEEHFQKQFKEIPSNIPKMDHVLVDRDNLFKKTETSPDQLTKKYLENNVKNSSNFKEINRAFIKELSKIQLNKSITGMEKNVLNRKNAIIEALKQRLNSRD